MSSAANRHAGKWSSGPWLSTETLSRLPKVQREFDLNRDPLVRRQMLDMAKSEAQRRREQHSGRGSAEGHGGGEKEKGTARMVAQDKPRQTPKPPRSTGRKVNRQTFNERWLAEQRDAVLAQARATRAHDGPDHGPGRPSPEPSR